MRRGTWIIAVGLLASLPIADTVLWHIAVGRIETGFDAWAAASKASNVAVTRGKTTPGGWPFSATLRIENVTLSGADPLTRDAMTWFAPQVVLRLSLAHPNSMDIAFLGEQHVHVGAMPDIVLSGSRLLAVASMANGDRPGAIDILADQAKLVSGAAGSTAAEHVRVHVDVPPPIGTDDSDRKFAFSAEGVTLPETVRWPLGRAIARLDFDGTLEGPLPPAQPLASWAAAWRDGGGSLQLQNLVLNWGPLSLTATATLALDDQLQPMGAGTSHVAGYAATLDALAKSGALTRSAATAAKAVLSLLAGTPGDGDSDDVDVPLTLQYRTLSMRQVPLVRLPEVDWSGQ